MPATAQVAEAIANSPSEQAPELSQQQMWDEVAKEKDAAEKPQSKPKKPKPAPAAEVPPSETVAVDPLKEMTDRVAKLESQLQKAHAHIGGLTNGQNQLREAQTQLLAASRAAAKTTGGDAPSQAQVREAMADPQEWAELKEAWPEWAAATEKFLDARMSQVQSGRGFDQAAFEKALNERLKGESVAMKKEIIHSTLDAISPGWHAEVQTDQFKNWMKAQSDEVKAMGASERVGDAAKMLRLYEASKQTSQSVELQNQRQKNLTMAASAPKGGHRIPQKSPDDMSAQELWDYEARKRARERSR